MVQDGFYLDKNSGYTLRMGSTKKYLPPQLLTRSAATAKALMTTPVPDSALSVAAPVHVGKSTAHRPIHAPLSTRAYGAHTAASASQLPMSRTRASPRATL